MVELFTSRIPLPPVICGPLPSKLAFCTMIVPAPVTAKVPGLVPYWTASVALAGMSIVPSLSRFWMDVVLPLEPVIESVTPGFTCVKPLLLLLIVAPSVMAGELVVSPRMSEDPLFTEKAGLGTETVPIDTGPSSTSDVLWRVLFVVDEETVACPETVTVCVLVPLSQAPKVPLFHRRLAAVIGAVPEMLAP